jgi:uncharacterized protein YbcI
MNQTENRVIEELAALASYLQQKRTGYPPKSVKVVLGDDTLVLALYGALTPAEQTLIRSPDGASKVQEFHRQLFASSIDEMRREIARITDRQVIEAVAEVEATSGTVVHAFSTGTMVQIFLLGNGPSKSLVDEQASLENAENEGLPPITVTIQKQTK